MASRREEMQVARAIAARGGLARHEVIENAGRDGEHWAIVGVGHGQDLVAIDDADCTPRPRYRESREAFERRMRSYGVQHQALVTAVQRDNRATSTRQVTASDGSIRHVPWCVCRWQGIEQADPEVARREYDTHPCGIADGDSIHRTYSGPIDKRPDSTAVPATAEERAANGVTLPGEASATVTAPTTTLDEDAEKRASLLELT